MKPQRIKFTDKKGKLIKPKGLNRYETLEEQIFKIFKTRNGEVQRLRIKHLGKNIWNYSLDVKYKK